MLGSNQSTLDAKRSFLNYTSGQHLWSVGQNLANQLGLGHGQDVGKFRPVRRNATKWEVQGNSLAAGALSSYVIDAEHHVWAFGCNDESQLGIATAVADENIPGHVRVDLPPHETVKQVVAGSSFAAALSHSGRLYVWGQWREEDTNVHVQIGSPVLEVKLPSSLAAPSSVKDITAGTSHLLIQDESGRLFGLGWNGSGQIGTFANPTHFILHPRDLTPWLLHHAQAQLPHAVRLCISRVYAAGHSSWCELTDYRSNTQVTYLFAWGCNTHGQLGLHRLHLPPSPLTQVRPRPSSGSSTISTSRLNRSSSVAATPLRRDGFVTRPTLVKDFVNRPVVQIVGGIDFSLFRTLADELLACGRGDFGQLANLQAVAHLRRHRGQAYLNGRPSLVKYAVKAQEYTHLNWEQAIASESTQLAPLGGPTWAIRPKRPRGLLRLPPIQWVAANSRTACAVSTDGRLYVWGDNYCGQLALGDAMNDRVPFSMLPIEVEFKKSRAVAAAVGWGHLLLVAQTLDPQEADTR